MTDSLGTNFPGAEITDEVIVAFVDGELPPDQAARVRAAIEDNEELQRSAERYRTLRAHIDQTFRAITRQPLPPRFHQLFEESKRNSNLSRPPLLGRWSAPTAIAASLAVGVFFGNLLMTPQKPTLDFALYQDGGAEGLLTVLINEPSGIPKDGAEIIATYQNAGGDICREFAVSTDQSGRGLACRQHGDVDWSVIAFTATPPDGAYLPAGDMAEDNASRDFNELLQGYETISQEVEAQLIGDGWE